MFCVFKSDKKNLNKKPSLICIYSMIRKKLSNRKKKFNLIKKKCENFNNKFKLCSSFRDHRG